MRSERVASSDDGRSVSPAETSRDRALPRLLTLPEVAAFLSVSPKTVRRLIASGELGCVRIGAQLRFECDTLLQWISARREQ